MLRRLRLLVLLGILVFVALGTWLDGLQTTDWDGPLLVALYAIDADRSAAAVREVARSHTTQANVQTGALETYFASEAREHGLPLDRPLRFTTAPPPGDSPPLLDRDAGLLGTMLWSLSFRVWNLGIDDPPGPTPTIRLFLLYHDPALSPRLPHSTGLRKGLLGIAHLFAAEHMSGSNHVVVAHELLHTLGATDKYDFATNAPLYPMGFAEPDRSPRYPQRFAELMAGRIPESEAAARTPESLQETLIGPATAREIGWLQASQDLP